ncbi:MAG: hypothetical protein ACKOT0_07480 [bacterium]
MLLSPAVTDIALSHPGGPAAALTDPSLAPDSHLLMLLMGHAAAYSNLSLDDVLTPQGKRIMESVWNTQTVHHINDTAARLFRLDGPILRHPFANFDAWKTAMTNGSAGRVKPRCPILVCIDTFDGGTVVLVPWQKEYIAAVTALGGDVHSREYPHADHFRLPFVAGEDARAWIAQRFADTR